MIYYKSYLTAMRMYSEFYSVKQHICGFWILVFWLRLLFQKFSIDPQVVSLNHCAIPFENKTVSYFYAKAGVIEVYLACLNQISMKLNLEYDLFLYCTKLEFNLAEKSCIQNLEKHINFSQAFDM